MSSYSISKSFYIKNKLINMYLFYYWGTCVDGGQVAISGLLVVPNSPDFVPNVPNG